MIETPSSRCCCPLDAPNRCLPTDHARDSRGRQLCCPYDDDAMAVFYGISRPGWTATPGRRAAMRKRRRGTIEEIAQRAASTRHAT
jgi:hypothetical protein